MKQGTEVQKRAFADYPEEYVPNGEWKAIHRQDNPDFGIGGIDNEGRLVVFGDDGWIIGYHLNDAEPELNEFGSWRLNAEYDTITDRQMPEAFMAGRDVSDWIWVHPRYRWLVEGYDE